MEGIYIVEALISLLRRSFPKVVIGLPSSKLNFCDWSLHFASRKFTSAQISVDYSVADCRQVRCLIRIARGEETLGVSASD